MNKLYKVGSQIIKSTLIQPKISLYPQIQNLAYKPQYKFFGSRKEDPKKEEAKKEDSKQDTKKDENNNQQKAEQQQQKSEQDLNNKQNQDQELSLIDKLLCNQLILEIKDESAQLKIKQEFEKLQKQQQQLDEEKIQLKKKLENLELSFNDQQKKISELRKHLSQQIEENEISFKRLSKEKETAKQFAIVGFAKDLLDVVDNLDRAIESSKHLDKQNDNLFEGVKLTKNCLDQILTRNHIQKINPLDQKFDPNIHEALFQYEDNTKAAGTIGNVAAPGYVMYERVLRPAKVGVIKKSEEKKE